MAKKSTPVMPVNPTLPNVSLEIGGTTYYLAFDFNALCTVEDLTGQNLLRQTFDMENLTAKTLRAVLYAALLKAQPDITLEQVGDLIKPGTLAAIYPKLIEAWFESMPKQEKQETEPKNVQEPESK